MFKSASFGLAVLLLSGCAPAPQTEQLSRAQLDRRFEEATKEAPGVVYGAVWRDGTRLVRAAGYADLASGRRLAPETPLAWFSVTKLFTATAVLQLSERGRIALDAPVSRYLPDIHLVRDGREATVRELLSHRAGLPDPMPITWIHLADEPGPSLEDMIRQRIGPDPKLDYVPGTKSVYSNLGFLLLGAIVQRTSGEPYERYVETNVLAPLGCRAAGFSPAPDEAVGYQKKWSVMGLTARVLLDRRFFGRTVGGYWEIRPFALDGAPYGGLRGPADCLLRFAHMILAEGQGAEGRVLSPASVRAMLTPDRTADGRPRAFGLAWRIRDAGGEPVANHEGGGGGYRSELRLYPGRGYAVAVIANETSFDTASLARIIVEKPNAAARPDQIRP